MSQGTPVVGKEFQVPKELSERVIRGQITVGEFMGLSQSVLYAIANVGHQMLEVGKLDDALTIFKGLVAASPMDSVFQTHLATVYANQDKTDQAIEHYENALRYNLANVDALAGLGEMYLRKGEVLKAVDKLQGALEKDPEGKKASSRRAGALLMMVKEAAEKEKAKSKAAKKK